jgi:uncharacterized protein
MPANLTPQYQKAEEEYRRAQTAEQRVEILERMLKLIPKHKGTEKLQADLKTRLKETRSEVETEKSAPKAARGVRIPRQGAGTVLIIGAPNSGKSRILAELTRAEPEVADYPFTTREPLPGMMPWEDVSVQLIDTPPVTASHMEPYILGMVRGADAVLLCFDGSSDDAPEQTCEVIDQLAGRKTKLSRRTGFADDDLATVHVNTLLVVTRSDAPDADERVQFLREMRSDLDLPVLNVRLDDPGSVEELRNAIYGLLEVIRVYTKKPGQPANYVDPFTIRAGGTIEDLALKVHHDIAEGLKFARVWGDSAHDGQSVGREHVLADRDMVELHV